MKLFHLMFFCVLGFICLFPQDVTAEQQTHKNSWFYFNVDEVEKTLSTPKPVNRMMSRDASPSNSQQCEDHTMLLCNPNGVSHVCCPPSDMCCNNAAGQDAYCVSDGGVCCQGGGGCDSGFECCGLGCIPTGSVCCESQAGYCPTNQTCIPPQIDGEEWMCSAAFPLSSLSFSLSFLLISLYVFVQHL